MFVSLIIPARNERNTIFKMVTMMLSLYPNEIREVIVVNDGSTDGTGAVLKKLKQTDRRIILINNPSPHGVGLALRSGLQYVSAKADYILTMDADFIRNISDVADFFENISNYDGLIGSRYKEKNSLIKYPLLKKFFNRVFHLFVRMLFKVDHSDLTNNFKLYRKEIFASLDLSATDFAINAELGLYPILLGYHIGELPVMWFTRSRNMGFSKFRLLSVAPGYVKVLLKALNIKRSVTMKSLNQRSIKYKDKKSA